MELLKIEAYSFNELSDAAQQRAIDDHREWNIGGWDWWDAVKEYFIHALELVGFSDISTYFSGFYSQGDGACFAASYCYKRGGLKALRDYAPNAGELHEIVKGINAVQKKYFYGVTCDICTSGLYCHANTMRFAFDNTVRSDQSQDGWYTAIDAADADTLEKLFKDLAIYYYALLKTEYEYLTSDDAVRDSLQACGGLFYADGSTV